MAKNIYNIQPRKRFSICCCCLLNTRGGFCANLGVPEKSNFLIPFHQIRKMFNYICSLKCSFLVLVLNSKLNEFRIFCSLCHTGESNSVFSREGEI